jgi:hypothetical protein
MSHAASLRRITALSAAIIVALSAQTGLAAEWGTLKGRFVYDGKAPVAQKCNVTKDIEVCTKNHPLEELITVGPSGGLANVCVWVRTKGVATHPQYDAKPQPVVFDNKNCRFTPHIAAVRTGQDLTLSNSDPVAHNSLATCRVNESFNHNLPPGAKLDVKFTNAERLPVTVQCGSHPWMKAYLLIQDHPYMAVSATDGSFEIVNLPAGVPLEFQVWHDTGYITSVTENGKKSEWKLGRFTATLKPGDNDLGDLLVSPEELE